MLETIIEYLKVIFIGIVEGITEWLPISSTGHMILVNEFIKLNVTQDFWNMFLVVIQLGAILAVCVLYFYDLNPFARAKSATEKKNTWIMWAKIIVGVLPAAIIGLPLNDLMEEKLYNSWVVAAALIVYGILFIIIENWRKKKAHTLVKEGDKFKLSDQHSKKKGAHFLEPEEQVEEEDVDFDFGTYRTMNDLSFGRALGIGFFQSLSLVPGTSRSGSTILGGLILGTNRKLAAEFSFYMAIPVMFGASLLKIVKFFANGNTFSGYEFSILIVGMIVAFVVSILSIKFLMSYIKTNDFKPFGWYRIILGAVVLLFFGSKILLA